jgi:hypothetical protein
MQVNLDVVVWCTCGEKLTQTKDAGLNVTISPCLSCQTEARVKLLQQASQLKAIMAHKEERDGKD